MKITALYNADGIILAAVVIDGRYDGPLPVPVASEGTEVGTFDVPSSATESRLDEICKVFRVDTRSKRLIDAKL